MQAEDKSHEAQLVDLRKDLQYKSEELRRLREGEARLDKFGYLDLKLNFEF